MALSIKTKSTTFQCKISPWATSFETDCKSEDFKKMISQLENTMKNFQMMGSDLQTE